MQFECVFFDFDGVIILNGQSLAFAIMADELNKLGYAITQTYLMTHFNGMKGEDILPILRQQHPSLSLPHDLLQVIRERYKARMLLDSVVDDYLVALLAHLPDKFICSSNSSAYINALLVKHDLKQYFPDQQIFSIDKVKHPKPDPAVYLSAIQAQERVLSACCAIEDSKVGVTAAKAANLYTIGYVGCFALAEQPQQAELLFEHGADRVITSFAELAC